MSVASGGILAPALWKAADGLSLSFRTLGTGPRPTLSSASDRNGAQPRTRHLLLFIWHCILDRGSEDRSKGFWSLVSPMPPRPGYALMRGRGPGRLSVFMRHPSALGLSQSLALNLPLALIFLWVLGRFPPSKGRGHKALPGQGPRTRWGAAASVWKGGRGGRDDQEICSEGGSEEKRPSLGAPASPGAALARALQP